ncbi:MAG: glycosyltransferase family 4 protein [Actinomycetota bacterium]|nr:glycosyltransferase family 4 protein [Actinomycetota bacterium]
MTPRVLVVHNRYRSEFPSGENQVVDGQIALLRGAGVEAEAYIRSSDEIVDFSLGQRLELGVRPIYSREDVGNVDRIIDRFRPDIVHVHNVYPLISPAIVSRARSRGCRVVQTVHNFRHFCVASTFFRDGTICMDCFGKRLPWPAVAHACYRGSRAQSLALGTAITRHRKTWLQLDRFLAVSEFVAQILADDGIAREQISVVPNFVPDPGPPLALGEGFLFAGRLGQEKGIGLLLDAWERSGLGDETELTIAGDGPERTAVARASARLAGVRYVGPLTPEQVRVHMQRSRSVVVPSIWFEGLPTVVLEAYASGRPVVATKIGGLDALVTEDVGWRAPADEDGLAATLRRSLRDPAASTMGEHARARYLRHFTPSAVLAELLRVYESLASPSLRSPRH